MSTARPAGFAHRQAARSRPEPRLGGLARFESMAFLLLTVVLVGVSGGLLWALGLNYDGISGSAPSKIHPATYMAVALVASSRAWLARQR